MGSCSGVSRTHIDNIGVEGLEAASKDLAKKINMVSHQNTNNSVQS